MSTTAERTLIALQLARIDHRHDDIVQLLAAADADELRGVVTELLETWLMTARFTSCSRMALRQAVAADALAQAADTNLGG